MSIDLLGEHFDIHTGGVDHREIHHINEIAQSEAYLGDGRDWVPMWMHNEFIVVNSEKISKSAGRMPLLADVVAAGRHPLVYRYFLLTAQYRSQLDLTDAALGAAEGALRRLAAREAARGARDWAEADKLRARLADLGWRVTDTPQGPKLEAL